MSKRKTKEYIDIKETREAYHEEMLIACQNGKPCSYGICDECPLNSIEEDEHDD